MEFRIPKSKTLFANTLFLQSHSIRKQPFFRSSNFRISKQQSMQTTAWQQAHKNIESNPSEPKTLSKWRPKKQPQTTQNLSCQKSAIVMAMLQSRGKSQVVFSHKRGTDNASEVVIAPRLQHGLDHATASLRFAAHARSNGEDWKEKKSQKEPNDLQELCAFSANVTWKMCKSGTKNDTKSSK